MILDRFQLNGKTALVTGARRGIGLAMAAALAEAGADIVGARAAVYAFIEKVKRECAPIDILVNNAGTILRTPAADFPDEYWDRTIEIDLNAQWILGRDFGPG